VQQASRTPAANSSAVSNRCSSAVTGDSTPLATTLHFPHLPWPPQGRSSSTNAIFTPKYIELQNGIKKIRVFVPEEDYDFVKRYVMNRLTGECEIRYES
jgi:hypothetical protein